MSKQAFNTTELVIGDSANKISIASDGSMTFADNYVPTVKLKDILGGNVVVDPAILVYVEETDAEWTPLIANSYGQYFFKLTINHNWNLTNISDTNDIFPIGVLVKIFNEDNKEIGVESIQCFANKVEIISSKKLTMKVAIKRIG
jgi:hypothetical protein